jgi:hypothetical protein
MAYYESEQQKKEREAKVKEWFVLTPIRHIFFRIGIGIAILVCMWVMDSYIMTQPFPYSSSEENIYMTEDVNEDRPRLWADGYAVCQYEGRNMVVRDDCKVFHDWAPVRFFIFNHPFADLLSALMILSACGAFFGVKNTVIVLTYIVAFVMMILFWAFLLCIAIVAFNAAMNIIRGMIGWLFGRR